jgi:hypothetical protein
MKRGRDRDAPDESLETRLVNLIVRIGDKEGSSHLSEHLEGLASALEGDLVHHRKLIIDTILDCARSLHTKSGVYGTLSGLLNASDDSVGRDIAEELQRELQGALDDHAPMAIRGLTRFAVELMNARVVSPLSTIELLEVLISTVKDEGAPTARSDWFCIVAMDALVLCGKTLSASSPTELQLLVSTLRSYAAQRKTLVASAPLLLAYGASTRPTEVLEHFDALYLQLDTMEADGGWSSPYLISPHRAFGEKLSSSGREHPLPAFTIPAHTPGCTYPSLHRLRLLPLPAADDVQMSDAAAAAADAAGGEGGGGGGGAAATAAAAAAPPPAKSGGGLELPAADRTLLEEGAFMLINAFSGSHKDCAKLLAAYAHDLGLDLSAM